MLSLTRIATGIFLTLVGLNSVFATKGDGRCGRYLCVNATVTDNTVIYQLTPLKEPVGWLALGFGRRMADSPMVILWRNEDGSTTVSQRYATGHHLPEIVERPPRMAWLPNTKPPDWHPHANMSLSFEIQRDHGHIPAGNHEPFYKQLIWGYSKYLPESSNPGEMIYQHYAAGSLKLDLNKDLSAFDEKPVKGSDEAPDRPVVDSTTSTSESGSSNDSSPEPYTAHELLVIAHGTLLSIGFLVLLPFGSLVARWTRTVSAKWFKLHRFSNFYLGLPVILIGFLLGPLAVFDAQASHFLDAHQVCGALLFGFYVLQILLGRYIHERNLKRQPDSATHPPSNILHAFFGLGIIALAFLQIRSGMDEWVKVTGRPGVQHWCHILLRAWAVFLPVAYFVGLSLLRRQFYQENQGLGPVSTPKHYLSLSPGGCRSPSTSQTVFDADEVDQEYGITKEAETEVPLLRRH